LSKKVKTDFFCDICLQKKRDGDADCGLVYSTSVKVISTVKERHDIRPQDDELRICITIDRLQNWLQNDEKDGEAWLKYEDEYSGHADLGCALGVIIRDAIKDGTLKVRHIEALKAVLAEA